jgi:UDP-GlcNAc:undecaprenyl-phosphate GlcNAc-1-phosphate transferase
MPRLLLSLIAMLATIGTGLLLVRKAVDWGFIDVPDERKIHTLPTPRTGGLAMVLGGTFTFLLALSLGWLPKPDLPWQTWVAGTGFVGVGALDDRFSFHPRQKFLVFLALSALAAWPWALVLKTTGVPWLPQAWLVSPLGLGVSVPILGFWFMAVPNAVNIEDAINGYMGGFTFLILFALALRGLDTRIFLGLLLGFLLLNWPKARHFMGDAGSFGCGFVLAESLLRGGALQNPAIAIVMTLPISMDVLMGIFRRLRLRTSLFSADRATCPHHILVLTKGNVYIATLLLWLNAAGFAFFGGRYWIALAQAILYALLLFLLNRKLIFHCEPRTFSPD